jgi:acetylornithine deacetylase
MDALDYAKQLVSFESTSVLSNVAVTDYAEEQLRRLGFITERIEYTDRNKVRKACVAARKGPGKGGMAYFGHTDVVPADPWFFEEHGPFEPTVVGDRLYGRGSCDMKGSIACMLAAAAQFSASDLKKPVYITCTADEEIGYGGAAQIAERSDLYQEMVEGATYGIIGEPTSLQVVHAHKGVCGIVATSRGRAAHSSTSEGVNANLKMIPYLVEMKRIHDEMETDTSWHNQEFDPPVVSWNIGINDFTKATNITPPQSICTVYFRHMPGQDAQVLIDRAQAAATANGLEFEVRCLGAPLYTDPNSEFVQATLKLVDRTESKTVSYGTDGAMFGAMKNLLILGPGSIAQAHTHDEWIALEQLKLGTEMYSRLIREWCC